MPEPFIPPHHPGRTAAASRAGRDRCIRRRPGLRLAAAALVLTLATVGCSSGGNDRTGPAGASGSSTADGVIGPLCELLPSGTAPGNPTSLVDEPADVALTWIPVLTRFESAVRAAEMQDELRAMKDVTILAPTDDAFDKKFSEDTIDELFIHRKDDLRRLLKSHLVEGAFSLSELVEAGSVTTLAGPSVKVTRADTMARIDNKAQTVCADYRVANARIHIIDAVLGDLPTTADGSDHRAH
ncbi:MAG TPA: fasciclin domain-containing protein [Micromonosporaceae bacterium]|nr:fasciclin domain-containing protein [Micromonosporaceae bacterium]